MKKLLLSLTAALLLTAMLASCTGNAGEGDTTPPDTAPPTTDTTEEVTEQQTEPPVQIFAPKGEAEIAGNFAFAENYFVAPTTREESVKVKLDGTTLGVNMHSTFYGTESAIDRDTYHWGNILRYTDRNIIDFQYHCRIGDLNGDRRGELLSYQDGTLTVYTMPKTAGKKAKKLTVIMTQELGFEGILIGTGHVNDDLYTDVLLFNNEANEVVLGLGSATGFSYVYAGALEDLDTSLMLHDMMACGDIDADGTTEILFVQRMDYIVYDYVNGAFVKTHQGTLPYGNTTQFYGSFAISDMNSDGAQPGAL